MGVLIQATTAAVTTIPFETNCSINYCMVLVANGLAGTEEVVLQMEYAPELFTDAYDYLGQEKYVLKATANIIAVGVPGKYRLVKPITASAVTVGLYTPAG